MLLGLAAWGQTVTPEIQVIASGGAYFEINGVSLSYTMGEPLTTTLVGYQGALFLTQGFQQPDSQTLVSVEPQQVKVDYRVYPNPTKDWLYVRLNTVQPVALSFQVFDAKGQETIVPIQRVQLTGSETLRFDLSPLPYGVYMLHMMGANQVVIKSFQIQKVH